MTLRPVRTELALLTAAVLIAYGAWLTWPPAGYLAAGAFSLGLVWPKGSWSINGEMIRDVIGLSAVGLLSFGAWLAWPPLGYMTAGALMLAGVWLYDSQSEVR
jgi:hypothetical protein